VGRKSAASLKTIKSCVEGRSDQPSESKENQTLDVFHNCLARKHLFLALISNNPRPPSDWGRQTLFQATRVE